MSELRAPDPTLTALDPHPSVGVRWDQGPAPVAHTLSRYPEGDPVEYLQDWPTCDPEMVEDNWRDVPADSARWFAVPCRTCFPDAPPPGHTLCTCPNFLPQPAHEHRTSGLEWQVSP